MTVNAGSEITVSNLTLTDSTSATATLTILATAALGPHNVNVATIAGTNGNGYLKRLPRTLI